MKRDLPTLALYAQVKEHISRKIQDGTWPAGHRLPSEHELVAQFGISRMTVNPHAHHFVYSREALHEA